MLWQCNLFLITARPKRGVKEQVIAIPLPLSLTSITMRFKKRVINILILIIMH